MSVSAFSPSCMIAPLPNCFSICARAFFSSRSCVWSAMLAPFYACRCTFVIIANGADENRSVVAFGLPLNGSGFGPQTATDLPHRLAQAVLVFYEGQPQKALPRLAEATPRADRHLRFLQQLH